MNRHCYLQVRAQHNDVHKVGKGYDSKSKGPTKTAELFTVELLVPISPTWPPTPLLYLDKRRRRRRQSANTSDNHDMEIALGPNGRPRDEWMTSKSS